MTKLLATLPALLALIIMGCAQEPDKPAPADTAKEAPKIDPTQATYAPKPGDTVIKWTFKTTGGFMAEKGSGDVYMLLDFENAPGTSAHILYLVQKGFYNGIKVHRVETRSDFALVQWGNPDTKKADWDNSSEGASGAGTVKREMGPKNEHSVGAVGLARSADPNSGDCQMYVCLVPVNRLDKDYSVWAHVVAGLDILKYVKPNTEIVSATVVQQSDAAKAAVAALKPPAPASDPAKAFADPEGKLQWQTLAGGLQVADLVEGSGPPAAQGQTVEVNYTGWLPDGTQFDKGTYTVVIGVSRVIKGWHQGLLGMKTGQKRKLIIPPGLAYGAAGNGSIPANATLIFDVEVVEIK